MSLSRLKLEARSEAKSFGRVRVPARDSCERGGHCHACLGWHEATRREAMVVSS
jgi:hypothetical protein